MLQKDPQRRPKSWDIIVSRLQKEGPGNKGKLDVSSLVQKATTSFLQATAQETKLREQRERREERNALLKQATQEPINVLKEVVDAFNEASEVGKLSWKQTDMSVEVSSSRGTTLLLGFQIIDDFPANGVYRVIGLARIFPIPVQPSDVAGMYDPESFGSFNLGYRVTRPEDRFGNWNMLRFEQNPLMGTTSYPRWFAIDLDDLPRQLQLLNALGAYQNQQRPVDHEWFQLLLSHLL